jgi:hypothetical protein
LVQGVSAVADELALCLGAHGLNLRERIEARPELVKPVSEQVERCGVLLFNEWNFGGMLACCVSTNQVQDIFIRLLKIHKPRKKAGGAPMPKRPR